MKHDWFDPRPNDAHLLMDDPFRKCRNCGAEQSLCSSHRWMRLVSRRSLPLVGRCKPKAKKPKTRARGA